MARSGEIIGALDLGSSKIACLIFETGRGGGGARILGVGHQRSRGLKSGTVVDANAAELAIRAAVAQAERAASVTLSDVYVAITCGRLASVSFAAHGQITGVAIREGDIARVFDGARAYAEQNNRVLVHMNRKAFRLDGVIGGDDPRGMAAAKLSADMHVVTADEGAIRNVLHVVERCHLSVAGLVAAPYASALAVTSEDERRLGVTVIDMGGGTTTVACFSEEQFRHCEVLATGGHHLTFDIAQNLRAPLAEAERIKALYASMVNAKSDVSDRFFYAATGESDGELRQLTRAQLADVVGLRIECLLQEVGSRVRAAGLDGHPVVLTGGASQLAGLAASASRFFEAPVRLGRPQSLPGLVAGADNPAFAAAVGLGLVVFDGVPATLDGASGAAIGYMGRVKRWIGSGF